MTSVLNSPEVTGLFNELMGGTATIMEKTFCQVFTCDDKKGRFTGSNIQGVCCVIQDRKEGKAPYIRVYDVSRMRLLFSCELYYGFGDFCQFILPNFLVFPFFRGFIGILFPNAAEGKKILDKVKQIAPKKAELERKQKEQYDQKKAEEKLEKEKNSISGKMKGFFGISKDEKPKALEISGPTGFKHATSVKMDSNGEINLGEMAPEFKNIFKQAGITKNDLQDKETAQIIMQALDQYQKDNEGGVKAPAPQGKPGGPPPPPPPPPPPRGAPPPPPPKPIGQSAQGAKPQPAADRGNLLQEIESGIKLKPVSKPAPNEIKLKEMNQAQQEDLTDYLGRMIAERRSQMTKGRKHSSSEEDSD